MSSFMLDTLELFGRAGGSLVSLPIPEGFPTGYVFTDPRSGQSLAAEYELAPISVGHLSPSKEGSGTGSNIFSCPMLKSPPMEGVAGADRRPRRFGSLRRRCKVTTAYRIADMCKHVSAIPGRRKNNSVFGYIACVTIFSIFGTAGSASADSDLVRSLAQAGFERVTAGTYRLGLSGFTAEFRQGCFTGSACLLAISGHDGRILVQEMDFDRLVQLPDTTGMVEISGCNYERQTKRWRFSGPSMWVDFRTESLTPEESLCLVEYGTFSGPDLTSVTGVSIHFSIHIWER